jgi:S1-C subfamily serine protease
LTVERCFAEISSGWWPSAAPSAWSKPSRRASSAPKAGPSAPVPATISSRPTPRSTRATKAKDIITAVNGEKVKTSRELTAKAATLPVGDTTKITVLRDGKEKTFEVKVAKRPLTVADAGMLVIRMAQPRAPAK